MPAYTSEEFLACALGREFVGCRHIAVGSAASLHAAGALLAAAISSTPVRVTILGSSRENFFSDGGRELFDASIQGRIDGFVLGGGQIDGKANLNFVGRGQYPDLSVRWPGSFGSPVMYTAVRHVVLFREEHSTRVLVPMVDFISAPGQSPDGAWRPGGPVALVTGKCIFSFDRIAQRFALKSVHPHSSLEDVQKHTGFEFDTPGRTSSTPQPTVRELALLRGEIADRVARTYPTFVSKISERTA